MLVDLIRPWIGRGRGGVDGHPAAFDAGGKLDEYRSCDTGPRRSTGPPFTFLALYRKHMPQALFEQVGAIQTGPAIQASLALRLGEVLSSSTARKRAP